MEFLQKIEEFEVSVLLPYDNSERLQSFNRFLKRFQDKIDIEGKSIKLDFKIEPDGELCAYYEDEYDSAFYFEDAYMKSLILEYGTMLGSIQTVDYDELVSFRFGLKVFPKNLAKAILSINTDAVYDEDEYDDSFTEYEPHFNLYNIKDDSTKTIKNDNLLLSMVGAQYHGISDLRVGMKLYIKRDWGNLYDEEAYGYYSEDDILIGYIPRREKAFVRLFMANDVIEAQVTNINDKFIDTVAFLSKDMIAFSAANELLLSKVEKQRVRGRYTEKIDNVSVYELYNFIK